ncbi:uncharacterized protein LOC125532583 [Triticum urartu]|nr:uncharacterized protein LOC125519055 [Triticum urartu]XP_048552547.1 uncharacterized protein LOC125532583 [Triticum urartu]
MPRNQIGDTVSGEVMPPPNQVGNRRLGPISGAEVLPKQVSNRTPVTVPPPSKQRKDQTVRTVSGGAVLPTQVGGRTPVSVPPSSPNQLGNRRVSTVSAGEVPPKHAGNRSTLSAQLPPKQCRDDRTVSTLSHGDVLRKQVGDRTPVSIHPAPKQRRTQTVGQVSGRQPLPQLHTTQQGRPASSSKPSACTALRGNTSAQARKPCAAATKTVVQVKSKKNKDIEEGEDEIRRLNELGLGDNVSKKDYGVYLNQLPGRPDVDISTKLDAVQLKELNVRHALYRLKYYQLSQNVPEDKLCYDKLKEDYPPSRLEEERFFKCYEEDGKLDWSFHTDYCKLAGLEDYQRLVPQNYGGYDYVRWDEYHKEFHSYEIEQEYVKYCEELSKKLKWMEAYVLKEQTSLMRGMILTRGTYQAMKIATDFSKIHANLAFSGFYEWFKSMAFDVTNYKEFDVLYYEIWQRCNQEKKFRDALDEVYELNRFPLSQNRMRCALENDTFCSEFEEEFLGFTACLKEFAEDKSKITEDKALELIAEALRKETPKPKFYEDYCRKKIDIAQAIGIIPSVPA